ncbi:SRPBCC domain-containing protein [Mucilaginibacter sp. 5C4]|uniref:SRPBCC domain-containing protein n=1 Tax=Mucilaginibacter sp. 5C4 TaxID=3048589 RepID=UPI002AC8C98F|nr:SRPBCC domain-containing protein [Mucilaginibacter sp. 5C4]MEB0262436.1 SRPBCC domain-containing protein [Mucilaginibacter sp. 10I4]MEB0279261.1 SRPBCC domain-containing protein [Mucilaginibacter sp. 10B2]MEB0300639.1 SRPBCC domain-containing protein [Mucilaginibacter sp. 5C4]WPX25736.1 SRPBCC domain-containing protein [Mucilaginibacter sp. 5C4]
MWETLWGDETYPKWTAPFCEGSKAVTNWQEGSKVLFTDHEDRGMISLIVRNTPYEHMSFKMLGQLVNGVEDFTSENAKKIAGAFENYTLTPDGDKTLLVVDLNGLNMDKDIMDYFTATWPKALDALNAISEQ